MLQVLQLESPEKILDFSVYVGGVRADLGPLGCRSSGLGVDTDAALRRKRTLRSESSEVAPTQTGSKSKTLNMHAVTVDNSGSPRKRTLSRGISEDESLRSIITEVSSLYCSVRPGG